MRFIYLHFYMFVRYIQILNTDNFLILLYATCCLKRTNNRLIVIVCNKFASQASLFSDQ